MTNLETGLLALPSAQRDELHDDIALALDAISAYRPSEHNLAEAANYLRHALRTIGGEA